MGVPLLNFEGGPGVPLLSFEGGPGVPFLNIRGVPGPTFKLWGGSRIPSTGVLVPLLHHAWKKFSRSFLTLHTCWQSFRLDNLTSTVSVVLPTRWQASIRSGEMSQPSFPKIFKTFSSRTSPETSSGTPTISRHSRLEYWAFAQHNLSKVVNLVNNKLLTFFVTASSQCSCDTDSSGLRTSSKTVLSLSSNLLCRVRTIGMRSCLRSWKKRIEKIDGWLLYSKFPFLSFIISRLSFFQFYKQSWSKFFIISVFLQFSKTVGDKEKLNQNPQ